MTLLRELERRSLERRRRRRFERWNDCLRDWRSGAQFGLGER